MDLRTRPSWFKADEALRKFLKVAEQDPDVEMIQREAY